MTTMATALGGFQMRSAEDRQAGPETAGRPAVAGIAEAESDEALLIAVGNQQDTAAFNKLFQRFSTRIYAMGVKLTRNEQLAHDLVQEAMVTVWQKAPLYDLDRGTAQSWIFTLTRNRCFDMLRKIKRQPATVSADDIWPTIEDQDSNLIHDEQGSKFAELENIDRCYEQLPEAQRAVVEQIYIHDRTHEEAARILEIPLGTLKSRLRLGMGKLRQLLGTDTDTDTET